MRSKGRPARSLTARTSASVPANKTQQHLVLGHQQRTEKRHPAAGQARYLLPDPPPERLRGRVRQARQQALRDLPLRL